MTTEKAKRTARRELFARRGEYDRSVEGLSDMGILVANLISAALTASDIQFHTVNFRVKKLHSAHKKVASKPNRYPDFDALTDLLGIRIITYFEDDVDRVSEVLRAEFQVDEENSVDKRANLDSDRFGYLSVHFILTLGNKREHLVEYKKFGGKKFEVQVRSVLQHAWAEIEHDLGYKIGGGIPRNLRRRFSRVAGLLESADGEFRALRDEIASYQAEVKNTINVKPQDLSINQDTLLELLRSNEVIKRIEDMIVELNSEADIAPLSKVYVGRCADNLNSMGLRTIGDLLDYVTRHYDRILKFSKVWQEDADGYFPDESELETPVGVAFWNIYLYWLSQEVVSGRTSAANDLRVSWENATNILRAAALRTNGV